GRRAGMLRPPRRPADRGHELQSRRLVPRLLVLQASPDAEEAIAGRLSVLTRPGPKDPAYGLTPARDVGRVLRTRLLGPPDRAIRKIPAPIRPIRPAAQAVDTRASGAELRRTSPSSRT